MTKILITGGCGFIGSHTSLLLLEKGYELIILDSNVNSSPNVIKKIVNILKNKSINASYKLNFYKGDVRDKLILEKIFLDAINNGKKIDGVIHFAGLKSVSESILNPLSYWENNVNGTIRLLNIMEKYNCKCIVFSSSATVYRAQNGRLLKEDDFCDPINPYGQTKLAIEKLLNDIHNSYPSEWRIACLRYFNPVGAHESGLIGEDPLGKPNNIYPQITKVAIGELSEIKVYGSDWPTNDGTGIRDYIHVMDLAEGHLITLNFLLKRKAQSLIVNLGTGKGTSVLELIKTFEKVNGLKIPFRFVDRRPGDNPYVVADNSLAKSVLNWEPKRNIADICKNGWNWQCKNPGGY